MKKTYWHHARTRRVLVTAGLGSRSADTLRDPNFKSDLVLYSSMTDNDLNNLVRLFNQRYPGIRIEIVNGSAGELTARIRAEKNNPQGDVMWGGLSNNDGMIYEDLFEPYLSPYEDEIYPAYRSNNGFTTWTTCPPSCSA